LGRLKEAKRPLRLSTDAGRQEADSLMTFSAPADLLSAPSDLRRAPTVFPTLEEFRARAAGGAMVPVWREALADLETPVGVFLKLRGSENAFLLESVEQGERLGRYSFIGANPSLVFRWKNGHQEIFPPEAASTISLGATPLETLRALAASRPTVTDPRLPPFFGGMVGFVAYDAVRDLEKLPSKLPDDLNLPDGLFMLADELVAFDHLRRKILVIANPRPNSDPDAAYREAARRVEALHRWIRGATVKAPDLPPPGVRPPDFRSKFSREEFEKAVKSAQEYILAGDIFQVVLSRRLSADIACDPFDVYRALRAINPSPYMFYLQFGDLRLAGSSPEILVRVTGREAKVRPIAGTRRRGSAEEEDKVLERELLADPKERSEHVMLVDLGRNDLGRVCQPGTVKVSPERFMSVERYSHVMHIVTDATGELAPGRDALDALAASFPAGTVSGAPKIRAMEIIEELEPSRRGPYAGAAGYIGFQGDMDMCIAIRTAVITGQTVHVQAGAGVVADSDPASEYQETVNKSKALLNAIEMAQKGLE
jgi:anthranilate synthase component 1